MTRAKQISELASEMMRLRWSLIPKRDRAKHVPHNGGARRKYPHCPRKAAQDISASETPRTDTLPRWPFRLYLKVARQRSTPS
jgi:hypothetical protein